MFREMDLAFPCESTAYWDSGGIRFGLAARRAGNTVRASCAKSFNPNWPRRGGSWIIDVPRVGPPSLRESAAATSAAAAAASPPDDNPLRSPTSRPAAILVLVVVPWLLPRASN